MARVGRLRICHADAPRRTEKMLRKVLAPGGFFVAIAFAATFFVTVCTVNSVDRYGESFPGFFVWENLYVPAVGEPTWTGVAGGVEYLSWVLEVDGAPVADADQFRAAFARRKPGAGVEYLLEKNGEVYRVSVEPMRLGFRPWASVLGIYSFDAIALLLLGIIVLYMKPGETSAQSLFLWCADLGLYMATSSDAFGPYWFRVPYFFFLNLFPAVTLYLLSRFPVGRVRGRFEDLAIAGVAVFGLAHATAANIAFHRSHNAVLAFEAASYTLLAAVGWAAMAFFAWHFFRTPSATVRDRIKVVLLGVLGAFILPVVMLFVVYIGDVSFPLNFLTVVFVLFPLAIGYAIARHDLFGIDRVIKRTLVYTTLSVFMLGIYTIGITGVNSVFEANGVGSRFAQAGLVLVLILITDPSRARIQDVIDGLYDRRRYTYHGVVSSTAKKFTTILDFDELITIVLRLIDETIQPNGVWIHTLADDGGAVLRGRLLHGVGDGPTAEPELGRWADPGFDEIVRELGVVEYLRVDDDPLTVAPAANAAAKTATTAGDLPAAGPGAILPALGVALAVPMRLEGGLVGFLSVGVRRAGGLPSAEDVELLQTVCDQLAVALENARAYGKIDALARGLEDKNIALESINTQLRETRDELVRQERLAIIGQMSAAVAHAIRNPLAGIKAAAQFATFEAEQGQDTSSLTDIISETDRLNDRISALLEFSKPFEPRLSPDSLNRIIEGAHRAMIAKARAKRVTIELTLAPSLPDVQVDVALFEQVVVELLANAVDASADGTRVMVRTGALGQASDETVWMEVEDSGPGIPVERRERVFDLFFTTKPGGTGFGLATVHKIVERHEALVAVTDGVSGGACFRVEFPRTHSPEI